MLIPILYNLMATTVTISDLTLLNKAIASAKPGSTIWIQNGTYTGLNLILKVSVSGLTIKAQTPGNLILDIAKRTRTLPRDVGCNNA